MLIPAVVIPPKVSIQKNQDWAPVKTFGDDGPFAIQQHKSRAPLRYRLDLSPDPSFPNVFYRESRTNR
jgi:hypothetical protein